MMRQVWRFLFVVAVLMGARVHALAWHDVGHMVVAQIAYLRLTPAAKRQVDRLLVTAPDKRALIFYCDKTYDPVQIAVWMDDIKGDSLNDEYANWHYTNHRPFFDGVPERTNIGPEATNVLDRINWSIATLRKGTGRDKTDAEMLGFLFHLVGDVHQPLHTTTRYTTRLPDGDAGGNGFPVTMPAETRIRNLHSYWDSAAGLFGFDSPRRPLDDAGKARIRALAEQLMAANPAQSMPEWREQNVQLWVEESSRLTREAVYNGIRENETPSRSYTERAQRIASRRIALAGYRLANVLNSLYVESPAQGNVR
jgi:hypothetical protein